MLIKEKKNTPQQTTDSQLQNRTTTTDDVEKAGPMTPQDAQEQQQQQEPQDRPSFFQSLHVFKNPQFLSLTLAELAASIGYLIPLYYMQSKFCALDSSAS